MSLEQVEIFYIDNKPSYAYLTKEFADSRGIRGIYGPSNLIWEKQVDFASPMEYVSIKRLKRIQKAYKLLASTSQIIIEPNLTNELFLKWYPLYESNLSQKEHGNVRIAQDWFDKSPSARRSAGLFVTDKNQDIIGGIIIIKNTDESSFQAAFRSHLYTKILGCSIADIIEYLIDLFAIENNYKKITRGTDHNIYGIAYSLGLAKFKINNHFIPRALDYKGSYYPRYLVFFQEYEEVLTYKYTGNDSKIELMTLGKNELAEYIVSFDMLK